MFTHNTQPKEQYVIGAMMMMVIAMVFVQTAIEFMVVFALQPHKLDLRQYDHYLNEGAVGKIKHKVITRTMIKLYKLGPWLEKSETNSLIFSLGLSFAMGVMFPAAGIISFMGAVGSTVLGFPLYKILRTVRKYQAWRDSGGTYPTLIKSKLFGKS